MRRTCAARRPAAGTLRLDILEKRPNESYETCDILVPNELNNAEHLTVRLGLQ